MDKLPTQLKYLMKRQSLSESALARKVNIPQPVISRLLSGGTSNPRISTLLALAQYFNISIEALIGADNLPSEAITVSTHYIYIHTDKTLLNKTTPLQMIMSSVKDKTAFAYSLSNNLMHPVFNEKTTLIISPEKKHKHGSFVLIKRNDSILIREIWILEDSKTLLTLPSLPSLLESFTQDCQILGTVIESHQDHG